MENATTNTKIIFKPFLARKLVQNGNTIVDIKPDRNNEGHTLFVFKKDEKFEKDLTELLNAREQNKEDTK